MAQTFRIVELKYIEPDDGRAAAKLYAAVDAEIAKAEAAIKAIEGVAGVEVSTRLHSPKGPRAQKPAEGPPEAATTEPAADVAPLHGRHGKAAA